MDDGPLSDTPGATFAASGGFSSSGYAPPENLQASFNPSLTNLLPPMNSSGSGTYSSYTPGASGSDSAYTGISGTSGSLDAGGLGGSNLAGSFEKAVLGDSGALLAAFVTNPQNQQTTQAANLANFQLSSAKTSQLFSYLLIGLGIFLLFTFLEKK